MGAFYDDECPPDFVLKGIDGSGVMMPVIFVMASFWATRISYAPFLDDLVNIILTLLLEREDVRLACCPHLKWVDGA
jgi:hypothetical protein